MCRRPKNGRKSCRSCCNAGSPTPPVTGADRRPPGGGGRQRVERARGHDVHVRPRGPGFAASGPRGSPPFSPVGATAAAGRAQSAGGHRLSGRSRAASADRWMQPWRRFAPTLIGSSKPDAADGGMPACPVPRRPAASRPPGTSDAAAPGRPIVPPRPAVGPAMGDARASHHRPRRAGPRPPSGRRARAERRRPCPRGRFAGRCPARPSRRRAGERPGPPGRVSARRGGGGARRPHRPARTRLTPP